MSEISVKVGFVIIVRMLVLTNLFELNGFFSNFILFMYLFGFMEQTCFLSTVCRVFIIFIPKCSL